MAERREKRPKKPLQIAPTEPPVLGRYTTHALIINSLGLDPPPLPSVFEDGFEA